MGHGAGTPVQVAALSRVDYYVVPAELWSTKANALGQGHPHRTQG